MKTTLLTIICILCNAPDMYGADNQAASDQWTVDYFIQQMGIKPEKILEAQIATYCQFDEIPLMITSAQKQILRSAPPLFVHLPKNDKEFEQLLHRFVATRILHKKILQGYSAQSALYEMRQQDLYTSYIKLFKTRSDKKNKLTKLAVWLKAFKEKQKNKEIPFDEQAITKAIKKKFENLTQQIKAQPQKIEYFIEEERNKFIGSLNSGLAALSIVEGTFKKDAAPEKDFFGNIKANFDDKCILQ